MNNTKTALEKGSEFVDMIHNYLKKYKNTPYEENINMALFMVTARVISLHIHKDQQEMVLNFIKDTAEMFARQNKQDEN